MNVGASANVGGGNRGGSGKNKQKSGQNTDLVVRNVVTSYFLLKYKALVMLFWTYLFLLENDLEYCEVKHNISW